MNTPLPVARPALPVRDPKGHKGSFGRVLLIGGSVGMSGAMCLAATAALKSGSGLVTAAVPRSIQSLVASFEPSYMTIGLPVTDEGGLDSIGAASLTDLLLAKDAIAIGPGLGQSVPASHLLSMLMTCTPAPIVMDADALNLAAHHRIFSGGKRMQSCIVTPHPGEFARLTGLSIADINSRRESTAADFAANHQLVVVLKGARTVVTDGRQIYVNSTGNSGMATGGSGDVLTGVITSLLGQGMLPFDAAALAVHAHGLAGDLAAASLGKRGMIASDLLQFLPAAWQSLEGN